MGVDTETPRKRGDRPPPPTDPQQDSCHEKVCLDDLTDTRDPDGVMVFVDHSSPMLRYPDHRLEWTLLDVL